MVASLFQRFVAGGRGAMRHDVHESATQHVSGAALYTHDLAVRDLRASSRGRCRLRAHAHARASAAWKRVAHVRFRGVITVLTARDVPGSTTRGPVRRDEPLFPPRDHVHGSTPWRGCSARAKTLQRQAA